LFFENDGYAGFGRVVGCFGFLGGLVISECASVAEGDASLAGGGTRGGGRVAPEVVRVSSWRMQGRIVVPPEVVRLPPRGNIRMIGCPPGDYNCTLVVYGV
jgi:hypothetical protein